MSSTSSAESADPANIRSYQSADLARVQRLYTDGLLAGQVAPNDTGADLDHIQAAYFENPRHHFWVAHVQDQVVGMIGVSSDEEHTAEIRRLRVDPAYQNSTLATALLTTAIDHCKHHRYLKVRLDTSFEKDSALDLFDKIGFQHTRSKTVHGKNLLEFYLDLYRESNADD